eukprot:GHVU01062490.1.p1 GENE.GHVU01062490.1~~GHVU01062490.1.p1  ORF type:complete len:326 (-),score=27.34 GHVU01062490.1:2749-3726(-)
MEALRIIRKDVLRTLVMKSLERAATTKPALIKAGDIVLCKWRDGEVGWRNQLYEGEKLMPKWTEPKRVLRATNARSTQFLVRSIWLVQKPRLYSRNDMRLVPETKYDTIRAANLEYAITSLIQHDKEFAHDPKLPQARAHSDVRATMMPVPVEVQVSQHPSLDTTGTNHVEGESGEGELAQPATEPQGDVEVQIPAQAPKRRRVVVGAATILQPEASAAWLMVQAVGSSYTVNAATQERFRANGVDEIDVLRLEDAPRRVSDELREERCCTNMNDTATIMKHPLHTHSMTIGTPGQQDQEVKSEGVTTPDYRRVLDITGPSPPDI